MPYALSPYARAVYTAVLQPTDDGRVVVGQMHVGTADPGRLRLWGVKTGGSHDDVGVVCLAPPLPAEQIDVLFGAHLKRCVETGTDPELTALYLATGPGDPALPEAPHVDCLDALLSVVRASPSRPFRG
jgi:hypothetical protein